jgi:hypothetical protein
VKDANSLELIYCYPNEFLCDFEIRDVTHEGNGLRTTGCNFFSDASAFSAVTPLTTIFATI